MLKELIELGSLHEELFEEIGSILRVGSEISSVYDLVEKFLLENDLEKIPYTQFLTVNVNSVVYHGVTSKKLLNDGDLVTVDVCFMRGGFKIDGAKTFLIGNADSFIINLVETSRCVVMEAIKHLRVGCKVSELLKVISDYVAIRGFYLFPDGMGHGIGDQLHCRPYMSLSNMDDFSYVFKYGDIFTIEPILFARKDDVIENAIGEGCISSDNRSSQFEVTIFLDSFGRVNILNGALLK